jgi:GT2 family glycosyltransferase
MIFGPFIMFRKSALEKSGMFDEQLVSGADYDLSIRLAFNGKAVRTNGLLGYYLNEGKGASTRPNSKQRLDRTAIELRYGIFDKIDYDYAPEATTLHLHHIIIDGIPHRIDLFVPNYRAVIAERLKQWKTKGLRKYAIKKVFQIEKIKLKTKNTLKRIYAIVRK